MKKLLRILIYNAIVASMLLSQGCKMGKNYSRPDLNLPQVYSDSASTDTASIVDIDWRNYFSDPNLIALIDTGLNNNFDLLTASQRVAESMAFFKQSQGALAPSFSGFASAAAQDPGENSLIGRNLAAANAVADAEGSSSIDIPIEDYQLGIDMSWELDIWGRLRRMKEAAKSRLLQTEAGQRAVQTALVAQIANLYYELLSLDTQLDIVNKNIALQREAYDVSKLLKDGGRANEVGVKQLEAQLLNTMSLKPAIERQIVITENALNLVLGRFPQPIRRADNIMEEPLPESIQTGVPSYLLARRPDIVEAEYGLVAANADVGAAQAAFYPALTLSGSGFLNSFDASSFFSAESFAYTVGAGLTAPIFQANTIRSNFNATKARRAQALFSYQQSVVNGFQEVSNALVSVSKQGEVKALKIQEVDALNQAATLSNELFRSGYATYLEVITAQFSVLQAELDLADTQKQLLQSTVDLYRALGGGWNN
ncbi:efflux transporter outer membrane subunit [Limibacter armeniacum]|uniref:efflux transporter outer membrane subunit n=1 Tax=Limibacter armeniacum TaxID=466084 RepID=UPI002FE65A1D